MNGIQLLVKDGDAIADFDKHPSNTSSIKTTTRVPSLNTCLTTLILPLRAVFLAACKTLAGTDSPSFWLCY